MEIVQQIFEGVEVSAFEQDGEFWFFAGDVARALGLGNVAQAVARLDDDEKGVISNETLGGRQEVTTVSESGLYSLILGSRKPQAKPFKRWVTHDLLPTLRRTGFYSTRPPVITVAGMARAYSRPLSAIPVWLDTYRLAPAGYAENPDTGKPVLVYWLAEVEEAFRGAYPEGHTRLRPYSGAWEPGPVPAEKIPLTAREARQKWHAEQRRYRLERDRAEERRLALKS